MKKTMVAAVIFLFFAAPAFAADNNALPAKGPGGPADAKFDQVKADVLKRIDERIARIQEIKTCVEAAQNYNNLEACREKFKEEMMEQRQQHQAR